MRRASMHPLVSPAERAQLAFDALHQPEGESALPAPGAAADRAMGADPGQRPVERGGGLIFHFRPDSA
jgi:hypothetical protein